jgi:hypothetical protein
MSESGRLARRMDEIRRGCNSASLAAARALYGAAPCSGANCSGAPAKDPEQFTPMESDLLDKRVRECFSGVVRALPGPESVRIAAVAKRTIDESVNPLDPDTRFSIYRGPAPCRIGDICRICLHNLWRINRKCRQRIVMRLN